MPYTPLHLAATAVITAGLLLTACGDDTEALSQEEFIEQADAVCRVTNTELDAIFEPMWAGIEDWNPEDPAAQTEVLARFDEAMVEAQPVMLRQVDEIRALTPPSDDEELIESMLDDLVAGVTFMAETASDAVAGDEAAIAFMNNDEDPLAEVNQRARAYGLVVCGEDG